MGVVGVLVAAFETDAVASMPGIVDGATRAEQRQVASRNRDGDSQDRH